MDEARALLALEDGSRFECFSFGFPKSVSGEVVFNTGMVGYTESFTDPSYRGQILVLTYPLVGNYGVPAYAERNKLPEFFESPKLQISGLVVSEHCEMPSHWNSRLTLAAWLNAGRIPAVYGIDTRALTKKLREHGVMLGKILVGEDAENPDAVDFDDPNARNLVAEVSVQEPVFYAAEKARRTVALIDCGAKANIVRSLLSRNVNVLRVPWDYNIEKCSEKIDALLISNGPGNPKQCTSTIDTVRSAIEQGLPTLGICLGNQILALAAGADTYKLKYGHRSQNQPCAVAFGASVSSGGPEVPSSCPTGHSMTRARRCSPYNRCYITSQNHGYAVDEKKLQKGWLPWFRNLNDNTNEGIKNEKKPFMSVQFHPEACPGPVDTAFIFDRFLELVK